MSAPARSASSTCARLCASTSIGMSRLRGAHPRHRRLDAAGQPDVVVLDQNAVVEPHAVIDGAAGAHRVLLERAQQRRGLARVEHDDAPARGVDELARQRGDAA